MECDCGRYQRPVIKPPARPLGNSGQGTVEYALVTAALLAVAVCFALVMAHVSDGGAAEDVLSSLTHRLPKGVLDVMLF